MLRSGYKSTRNFLKNLNRKSTSNFSTNLKKNKNNTGSQKSNLPKFNFAKDGFCPNSTSNSNTQQSYSFKGSCIADSSVNISLTGLKPSVNLLRSGISSNLVVCDEDDDG
ncbi:hypothetical protein HDU92_002274 [Lobulomyces angularis]|nr:hypothetical protein HDU92_002274 [Lobulomyces angularis]